MLSQIQPAPKIVKQEASPLNESIDSQAQALLDMIKDKTEKFAEPKLEDLARDFKLSKQDFYH